MPTDDWGEEFQEQQANGSGMNVLLLLGLMGCAAVLVVLFGMGALAWFAAGGLEEELAEALRKQEEALASAMSGEALPPLASETHAFRMRIDSDDVELDACLLTPEEVARAMAVGAGASGRAEAGTVELSGVELRCVREFGTGTRTPTRVRIDLSSSEASARAFVVDVRWSAPREVFPADVVGGLLEEFGLWGSE